MIKDQRVAEQCVKPISCQLLSVTLLSFSSKRADDVHSTVAGVGAAHSSHLTLNNSDNEDQLEILFMNRETSVNKLFFSTESFLKIFKLSQVHLTVTKYKVVCFV